MTAPFHNTDHSSLICKPPYERNPDFTGITANMIF